MQTDRKALLAELTLDRTPAPIHTTQRRHWIGVGILILSVALASFWFRTSGTDSVPPATAATQQQQTVAATPDAVPGSLAGTPAGTPARSPTGSPAGSLHGEAAGSPTESASRTVLDGSGYVVARRQATVSAKTTSRVLEVRVEEGMTVERGQILAVLDDSNERAELALAAAELAAARAARQELAALIANAERALERARVLEDRGLLSTAELDDRVADAGALRARLERAQKDIEVASERQTVQRTRLEDLVIRAPFAGVVVEKSVQPGEIISPVSAGGGFTRTGIATIVDMDSLEVGVDVNEAYIERVFAGQPVEIRLNAYPERVYSGRVLAVIPSADRSKATIPVRIAIDGLDGRVLPEMGVRVGFIGAGA